MRILLEKRSEFSYVPVTPTTRKTMKYFKKGQQLVMRVEYTAEQYQAVMENDDPDQEEFERLWSKTEKWLDALGLIKQ